MTMGLFSWGNKEEHVEKQISFDILEQFSDEQVTAVFHQMNADHVAIIQDAGRVASVMQARKLEFPDTALGTALATTFISQSDDEPDEPREFNPSVLPEGPQQAPIAFIAASPSSIDGLRGRPLVGPQGKTFQERYLEKAGFARDEVFIMHLVPEVLKEQDGQAREPTDEEILAWRPWFEKTLKNAAPGRIVALGTVARDALGDSADEWAPHPCAIRRHGETAEVSRKMRRVRKFVDEDLVKFNVEGKICKAEESGEKRLVTGVVAEPESVDTHGDVIDPDTIQQAAHNFLIRSRVAGEQHETQAPASVVESFIAPDEMTIGDETVKKDAWIIVMKVHEDEFWQRVKSGDFTGFSLGGFARREPA